MVSSDYFNIHDEWWFDTEEAARKTKHHVWSKASDCLTKSDTMVLTVSFSEDVHRVLLIYANLMDRESTQGFLTRN